MCIILDFLFEYTPQIQPIQLAYIGGLLLPLWSIKSATMCNTVLLLYKINNKVVDYIKSNKNSSYFEGMYCARKPSKKLISAS